ncbi:MAG: hypothetical protein AAF573_13960 [Bacteroidota bacterium]
MKTNPIIIIVAFFAFTLLNSSCGPAIFKATFDSDTVNRPPDSNPPGAPANDKIKGNCGMEVITSSVLNSKAMRFHYDTNCGGSALMWFEAEPIPTSNKSLNYSFVGYPESSSHKRFHISFAGGHFKGAFQVIYEDGTMYLTDGGYNKHNIGTYVANQKQLFVVNMNRNKDQYNLSIIQPGSSNISLKERPISEDSFWGQSTYILYLFYDIDDADSSPNGYVIDEVKINKEK